MSCSALNNELFTSNTQLFFLPGAYYFDYEAIIQNVHNISLIGNDTTLVVHWGANITIINSSMVTFKNFVTTTTYNKIIIAHNTPPVLYFRDSYYISLHNIVIMVMKIKVQNVMGESILSNITSHRIEIHYDDSVSAESESIHKLIINDSTIRNKSCDIIVEQVSYGVSIIITDSIFSQLMRSVIVRFRSSCTSHHENAITFNKLQFLGNNYYYYPQHLLGIFFSLNYHQFDETINKHCKVKITNCYFVNNNVLGIIHGEWHVEVNKNEQNLVIINCIFANNIIGKSILSFHSDYYRLGNIINAGAYIINSNFLFNTCARNRVITDSNCALAISNTKLQLIGPIIIYNNTFNFLLIGSFILFHKYIEFSQNNGHYMIYGSHIILVQEVVLNITKNDMLALFLNNRSDTSKILSPDIPLCYFQFYGSKINMKTELLEVVIRNSKPFEIFGGDTGKINCRMPPSSAFYKQNPLHIYQQFVHCLDDQGPFSCPFTTGVLCDCSKEESQTCYTNMGPIFPGQTLIIHLYINIIAEDLIEIPISIDMYSSYLTESHCKVLSSNQILNRITRNCTEFHFTILSNNEQQCELFLNAKDHRYITIFYVKLLKCPMGFTFDINTERCECDLLMNSKSLTIRDCNINNQSVLRPANSWISADTRNNSHFYQLSPSCPFQYCLPHSSYLNFSTPNLQCQFNRSGLLCGQCQQRLSTTFGSSTCHLCTNIYLLLIIPITIAGLLLVLLLFLINLTVTDGTINAFIMYTNIISINDHVFFTDTKHAFAHTFISLANLDLGIQTCFYNGMDDYAKMWLQLAFPIYLTFIAILLIVTSCYSITVQRLTARRAVPVLATLFLLSYTKILRTISGVLFSYSTIIHLPSKHATLVWSVDANIPLFGIKFTILFIVCLILFLVLVPFNIILIFTRTLSKFHFANKFKPLLDAYQGPYKLRFYYWTGLQLLIRAVFFGISALDRSVNLTIGSIIVIAMIGVHGVVHPFNNSIENYQELLYITNLQILYILTLSDYQGVTTVNIMITLAAIQLIFIIIHHIIAYSHSGVIRIKINHFTKTVTTRNNKLKKSPNVRANFQLHNIEIPEVTYNYREYREPLIGQD